MLRKLHENPEDEDIQDHYCVAENVRRGIDHAEPERTLSQGEVEL